MRQMRLPFLTNEKDGNQRRTWIGDGTLHYVAEVSEAPDKAPSPIRKRKNGCTTRNDRKLALSMKTIESSFAAFEVLIVF